MRPEVPASFDTRPLREPQGALRQLSQAMRYRRIGRAAGKLTRGRCKPGPEDSPDVAVVPIADQVESTSGAHQFGCPSGRGRVDTSMRRHPAEHNGVHHSDATSRASMTNKSAQWNLILDAAEARGELPIPQKDAVTIAGGSAKQILTPLQHVKKHGFECWQGAPSARRMRC